MSSKSGAPSQEALSDLARVRDVETELESLRCDIVRRARAYGCSWEQIAEVLGVSRQSAWQYYTARFSVELDHRVSRNTDLSEEEAMRVALGEIRAVRRRRR